MHASLILLITALAASVAAAPVAIEAPAQSPNLLMARDVDEEAIAPSVENLKRQILERLDAIVQRSTNDDEDDDDDDNDDDDLSDTNEKRRLAALPIGLNPRDIQDQDVAEAEKRGLKVIPRPTFGERGLTALDDDDDLVSEVDNSDHEHLPSSGNLKREARFRGGTGASSNFRREARFRGGTGASSNFRREARFRGGTGASSNFRREARFRGGTGASSNFRREARFRGGTGASSNFRREA